MHHSKATQSRAGRASGSGGIERGLMREPDGAAKRRWVPSLRRQAMALQIDNVGAEAQRARRGWIRESAQDDDLAPGSPRRISIVGLGYVGAVSLACLARDGHEMFVVDIDPGKLELLRRGQAPIVETGIQELTRAVMRGGTVNVTDSVRDAIRSEERRVGKEERSGGE